MLAMDSGSHVGRRALCRRLGGSKRRSSTDRARCNTREFSSCQHDALPFLRPDQQRPDFPHANRKSFTVGLQGESLEWVFRMRGKAAYLIVTVAVILGVAILARRVLRVFHN